MPLTKSRGLPTNPRLVGVAQSSQRRTAAEGYVHEPAVLPDPGISEVAQGKARGLSSWRGHRGSMFKLSSQEHCQKNDRFGKLPDQSMAQFCHNLTQQEALERVLPGSCLHPGPSMGLGQVVS